MGIQTDRAYRELGRSRHFWLDNDAYIIGFEKRALNSDGLAQFGEKPLYGHLVKPLAGNSPKVKDRNRKFSDFTQENRKIIFATQLVSQFENFRFLLNAYESSLEGEYDYSRSLNALQATFEELQTKLQKAESTKIPYSHLLIMSMGWNNDQAESMRRYRIIAKNINDAAPETTFNPLIIGITWPSVWSSVTSLIPIKTVAHVASYGNKANDADELGMTWMNWIINSAIPNSIVKASLAKPPKVVLLGHSLGARILGTALFSREHLIDGGIPNSVDLFIGLQGAFSAHRFVEGDGREAHLYSDFRSLKKTSIALTSSKHDRANPIARFVTGAAHVGGIYGMDYAKENVAVFENIIYNGEELSIDPEKINLIDASSIVQKNNELDESAHNDILDPAMGALIWKLLVQLN